ncbi:MAG: MFS transporter [Gammaproteobacteria bacterium]|nr:MFS transporter [Gammaproteobacteria bacterium]
MLKALKLGLTPLLSLFIVILGNGLLTTLTTVSLHLNDVPLWLIGIVVGAYFAGLMVGSFRCEIFIGRVGHIRAYAVMASGLAVASLLQGIFDNVWFTILFRFVSGFCVAGVFIIIESWLLARSKASIRGQILAVYMIALYGSQAIGQFILGFVNPQTLLPFCLIAILASLSVIPLSFTYIRSPRITAHSALSFIKLYKLSPAGVVGCVTSGLILGGIYGLMPLFVGDLHYSLTDISVVMGTIILGGMALQYPVGRLSDFIGRRKVLIAVSALLLLSALTIMLIADQFFYWFLFMGIFFGGFAFTLYPLSISHSCDYLQSRQDIVGATQGLLLAYSIGATVGPMIAAGFLHVFNTMGLMIYFMVVSGGLILFLLWRSTKREAPSIAQQQDYVVLPCTSPIANELAPRSDDEAAR